ncbi:MAG: CoA-binding protein [bacterium]|nr:CoA-binding protein [bacterium]
MPSGPYQDPAVIRRILGQMRRIAMVGLSANEMRPSYFVAYYMNKSGYRITPVNPRYGEIMGKTCYPDLLSLPEPPEIVNVFRRPEEVEEIADQAIAAGAKALWLQFGVINEAAARRASEAGLEVVMDLCIKIEHGRIRGNLQYAGIDTGIISSRTDSREI